MVVNVEKGTANPSVATLLGLSDALGVGLRALVEPPRVKVVKVVRHGEGAVRRVRSGATAPGRVHPGLMKVMCPAEPARWQTSAAGPPGVVRR
jgi:hypothetical protein